MRYTVLYGLYSFAALAFGVASGLGFASDTKTYLGVLYLLPSVLCMGAAYFSARTAEIVDERR